MGCVFMTLAVCAVSADAADVAAITMVSQQAAGRLTTL
jgi:hypothetical protein